MFLAPLWQALMLALATTAPAFAQQQDAPNSKGEGSGLSTLLGVLGGLAILIISSRFRAGKSEAQSPD